MKALGVKIRITIYYIFAYLLLPPNANACTETVVPLHVQTLATYNITASDTHNFVWFRVAKVGTRSILSILKNHCQLSVNGYKIPFDPLVYRKYFKFAFVRNPWDRVVSCYFNKVVNRSYVQFSSCFGKDFDFFVDFISKQDLTAADIHIRLQTALIPLRHVDFIGRLENFTHDLQYVLNMLGIYEPVIPHNNSTQRTHYSKYYTERTKAIIAKKYQIDIQTFGYQFEEITDDGR